MKGYSYSLTIGCQILCLWTLVCNAGIAGNVKLVAMNGNQYWFSSSSPYSPNLNFHLAYQYCRTLGLQLVVLETKEEVETISAYLNNEKNGPANSNNYWTSGNKLGADSWIWMSSGDQLNSSFSDYWLRNTNGSPNDSSRQCMSMKAPITKRAIFTAEECGKSLPFICEQVRCLYYNYPVTLFPDPSELRADLEQGQEDRTSSSASLAQAESRSDYLSSSSGFIARSQNFISPSATLANRNNLDKEYHVADLKKRIVRPQRLSNSFYRRHNKDSSTSSTTSPTLRKTTRDTLWNPNPDEGTAVSANANSNSLGSVSATIHKTTPEESSDINNASPVPTKPTIYISGKILRPSAKKSNFSVSSSVSSSFSTNSNFEKSLASPRVTHLEIVTSKSAKVDGRDVSDEGFLPVNDATEEIPAEATLYTIRYGETTNPTVVFDDTRNDIAENLEDVTTILPDNEDISSEGKYFHGNGVRRPDTSSIANDLPDPTTTSTPTFQRSNGEMSQYHSPARMLKFLQQNHGKTPISWSAKDHGSSSVTIIAHTSPRRHKLAFVPRLRLKTSRKN